MSGFTAIELNKLPAPTVVEQLDYETILSELTADLIARDSSLADVLSLETEPLTILLQVFAYRELILRQRINEASKSVMLAFATGADLDHLGALFGVSRLLVSVADTNAIPPIDAVYEADSDYRRRIQLSLEGFSTAGPEGAYIYHALSADADVLDAGATSPTPGDVVVTVLSRTGNGSANAGLLSTVNTVLSADDVRPLTDNVTVQSATIINYSITATLYFYSGPDASLVQDAATAAIETYVSAQRGIGQDVTLSGIYAALHQPGVQRVELASPSGDISVNSTSAAYCTAISITNGGYDE